MHIQVRSLCLLLVLSLLLTLPTRTFAQTDDTPPPHSAEADVPPLPAEKPWLEQTLENSFENVNKYLGAVIFFDVSFGAFARQAVDAQGQPRFDDAGHPIVVGHMPFIVVFLAFGALFFTIWHKFINIRAFRHAINVVRGKYDDPNDPGEVSHFRALTSALSATVGLGNIAGVAIAIDRGGPGAVFWMMLLALFGMTMKFHECTLAQMYRLKNPDGSISGGPMYYLKHGLAELGRKWGTAGKVLAVMFAIMCMGGAIGGGNMFQANQSFGAFASAFDIDREGTIEPEIVNGQPTGRMIRTPPNPWPARGFGIIMAGVVGMVIIGGIKRIGATTSRIVPFMCGIYVAAALVIIIVDIRLLPHVAYRIVSEAFSPQAMFGGLIGVMMIGFQRAAFSNEAGLGSAAIAHAAAKTDEPVREGVVALLEPFIDTVIICFMTAAVVIITGAFETAPEGADGAAITMHAFRSLPFIGDFFPYILTFCIILFAYSTMISWCYYGERAWGSLFGYTKVTIFRIVFIIFVFIGSVMSLSNVLDFCDLMILCMAFPNIIGGIILAPKVKRAVQDYWDRYRRGLMRPGARDEAAEEGVVI